MLWLRGDGTATDRGDVGEADVDCSDRSRFCASHARKRSPSSCRSIDTTEEDVEEEEGHGCDRVAFTITAFPLASATTSVSSSFASFSFSFRRASHCFSAARSLAGLPLTRFSDLSRSRGLRGFLRSPSGAASDDDISGADTRTHKHGSQPVWWWSCHHEAGNS